MDTQTKIVAYSPVEAALAELESRYKGFVVDVRTPDGMAQAKSAYKDVNGYALTLEAARVQEKAASLAYGRFVDSEAKRISERIEALRVPIKSLIETETKRVEREREEKIRIEQDRIAAEERARREEEEKTLAAARAEIARQQAQIAAAAAESRAKIEREELAARMIREEADRASRMKIEQEERAARQVREAEEAKLREERAQVESARRASEEAARKLREAEEEKAAAERRAKEEAERKAREAEEEKKHAKMLDNQAHMDGIGLLHEFVRRFGARQEFARIVTAINEFLEAK